jgi:Leucine-rich repeat (LRR) protein
VIYDKPEGPKCYEPSYYSDLSMNDLVFLPRKSFSSNLALAQLVLSHNRLSHLPEGLLISHNNLTILDVSNNDIESLEGTRKLLIF